MVLLREADLAALVDEIMSDPTNSVIAVDAEWHGAHPCNQGSYVRTVQLSRKPRHAACVVLRDAGEWPASRHRSIASRTCAGCSPARRSGRCGLPGTSSADLPWLLSLGLDLREQFKAPVTVTGDDVAAWQDTRNRGGFDTGLAAHACNETGDFGLKALAPQYTDAADYEKDLQEWKAAYCKEHKIKPKQLAGFGDCPNEILTRYGLLDADITRRLYDIFNRPGGLLDADSFGHSSRRTFWIAMRATAAILEMELTGLAASRPRLEEMTTLFADTRAELLAGLRAAVNWPSLNPGSPQQCRELLFGEQFNGKRDKGTKLPVRVRPIGALSLGLTPIKTTGKPSLTWADVVAKGGPAKLHRPPTKRY